MRAKQEDIDADRARSKQVADQINASLTPEERDAIEHRIVEAIAQLPTPIRSVFLLRHIHRKTRAETAHWLAISCRRVDQRLNEGLVRVMDYVGRERFAAQDQGNGSAFDAPDPASELPVVGALSHTGQTGR
jgi:DNA-directed RNA polymerase specialized sigma24 family protein